jgi:hypothetical protein
MFSSQADFQLTIDKWTLSLTNQLLHVTVLNWTADKSNQQLTRCFKFSCLRLGTDHIENTVSIVTVQQYFERCIETSVYPPIA